MRILLSFLICCLAFLPCSADAFEWSVFKGQMVKMHPVFLKKNHKYAKCHPSAEDMAAGRPVLLGSGQVAATSVGLTKMYDHDYRGIEEAFAAAFASNVMMGASESRADTQYEARTTAPDLVLKQKQENIERSQDVVGKCVQNPLGYVFSKSDEILDRYSSLLEMEQRDLSRGVTEDLAFADIAFGNMGRAANFFTNNGFDDDEVSSFRLVPSVLAWGNKNPRPEKLNPDKVQDARYLTREAGLSVYRSVMTQPWREYQMSRMKVIPFRLIRDWMEEIYQQAMAAKDENFDAKPEESGGFGGDPSAPVQDSGAVLNKVPVMNVESCTRSYRNNCKPGMVAGKPNPNLVKMTQENPPIYALVQKYAAKHNVPVDFLSALIGAESSGGRIDVRPNGVDAAGIGMHKPGAMEDVANYLHDKSFLVTCKWVNSQCDPRMDKAKSVEATAVYLKLQMNKYNNDMVKAFLAYNQGPEQPNRYLKGKPMNCEGIMYTMNTMCIPGTAILEGVKLQLPEDYAGEPVRDVGQDVLPPLAEGEEPMRTDVHVLTEGEYKRQLSANPLWNDMTMLSQEQVYDYLGQFFNSDIYLKLVYNVNAGGALRLRLPIKALKYRLWDKILKDIQLGSVLDTLASIPEYNDSLKQVEALFDQRGGR